MPGRDRARLHGWHMSGVGLPLVAGAADVEQAASVATIRHHVAGAYYGSCGEHYVWSILPRIPSGMALVSLVSASGPTRRRLWLASYVPLLVLQVGGEEYDRRRPRQPCDEGACVATLVS